MKKIDITEGQISLWDIEITKINEKITEVKPFGTVLASKITKEEILKEYLNSANKIVKTSAGRYIVQKNNENLHLTSSGELDFKTNGEISILPIDEILYSRNDEEVNDKQKKILEDIKSNKQDPIVVKRYGDKNYIVITKNETISINQKGWILLFNCKAIYKPNEVIEENKDILDSEIEIGNRVKINYKGLDYIGKVVRIYGPGKCTINVSFNNMQTAFYKEKVKKVC